jgi:acetoacetyl-CoA reductase
MSRVALVTGGTRGIGKAIVKRLKDAGLTVAAGYAGNEENAKKVAEELGVFIVKGSVDNFEDCKRAAAEVEAALGPIDVLVNNAGITRDGFFHKMSKDQWQEVIHTNMDSVFNMTRQVIEGMRERGWGRIINISSINGQKGQAGQTNYSAAKAGMIGFTKALAMESANKGITVNCVAPGYTSTEMVSAIAPAVLEKIVGGIPVGRLGTPEEIAEVTAFLVSDNAAFITGATIAINGGQHML